MPKAYPIPSPPMARQAWNGLLDLLFPPRCVACDRTGAQLCDGCINNFLPAAGDRCARCWSPRGASDCAHCATSLPAFDSLRAAYVFEGRVRDAVHAVKYQGATAAVGPLIAAVDLRSLPDALDRVVPVPMAGRRRRVRGFNQAHLFATRLGDRIGVPVDSRALRRTRAAPPQARQPDLEARRRNVRGAFTAERSRVHGRRILVVDDVTTSGATLDACAQALRAAGAESVHAWALARED